MLMLISPAKTLDYETPVPFDQVTQPELLAQSKQLVGQMKKMSAQQVSALMGVSDKIAALNVSRFQHWKMPFTEDNARQAIYAFKGDVYQGLDAYSLSTEQVQWAQQHLRILSGLYGLLKPLDLMQPYRLEMGIQLENKKGKNLYEFWGDLITEKLNKEIIESKNKNLINLASNEYFKSINAKKLKANIINPIFKDEKNGKYKIISFYAKKARGLMARYIIENEITDYEKIKSFNSDGYYFCEQESSVTDWVFYRNER